MASEKLSISLPAELASVVRESARASGVSVSLWMAEAAEARARNRLLGEAVDADAEELGAIDPDEADRLIRDARSRSITSTGRSSAA